MMDADPQAVTAGCPVSHVGSKPSAKGCPVNHGADKFDPFSREYQVAPSDYVRWAREGQPVFFSDALGYWVVTRYDDAKAILRDPITFSPANVLERVTPPTEESLQILAGYGYAIGRTLVNEDEPMHMERRRLLMQPFTPDALASHEGIIRKVVRERVSAFVDKGRVDLVPELLWEVPLTVALHFLGVPEADMNRIKTYSRAHIVNIWGRPEPQDQAAVAHGVGAFWQFAGELLEKMRKAPNEPGWMQYGIRQQEHHPDVVTDGYLHSMMMAGTFAAHESTANAAANAIKLLLQHPSAWRDICNDPSLIPGAVEECLRYNGPVTGWRRVATKATTVGGLAIPAGAKVLMVLASANRDGSHFPDPDLFDIRRSSADEHLTFGYGAHQCMGKNVARLQLQALIGELALRLPHLHLCEQEFSYVPNVSFNGPKHLWVDWDPKENPETLRRDLLDVSTPIGLGRSSRQRQFIDVVVEIARHLTPDVLSLRLASRDGKPLPSSEPGSHIEVLCGSDQRIRHYSLSGVSDGTAPYEIAVLRAHDGRGGSQWIHDNMRTGAHLRIRPPRNHFRFDETRRQVIFLAGGIGIVPIMPMAQRARTTGLAYEFHYCGRSRSHMVFLEELKAIHGSNLIVHVSDEGTRLDLAGLLSSPRDDACVYACGPTPLLEELTKVSSGWPADSVRTEHFEAEDPLAQSEGNHGFEVELRGSGFTVPVAPDQTVLQALLAANIDVAHDCSEGLCGSCEVRVVEGDVDHRDKVLTSSERASNQKMLVCCSRARGTRIALDI